MRRKGNVLESAASEALSRIATATETATKTLAAAAEAATKVVSTNAAEAVKVVSTNAAEAAKVVMTTNAGDHDLLQRIATKVDDLREDIKEMSTRDESRVSRPEFADHLKTTTDHENRLRNVEAIMSAVGSKVDHENRLRVLEASMWKTIGINIVIAAIISIAAAYVLRTLHG